MIQASIRHKVSITLAMIIGFGGIAAVIPTTHAELTCTGTETFSFSPGVTFSSRNHEVIVQGTLSSCISSSDSNLSSGTYQDHFNVDTYCPNLVYERLGTRVINWNNGKSSTFAFTNTASTKDSKYTGSITEGEFAGYTAVEYTEFNLDCSSQGVTELVAAVTLTLQST